MKDDIDALLVAANSADSEVVADELIEWADQIRNGIRRGDMVVGILTSETVAKIPIAYRAAAVHGKPTAWLKLAWWHARPEFGSSNIELAEAALAKAIEAHVQGAELEFVKIVWFFKGDNSSEAEQRYVYEVALALCDANEKDAEAHHFLGLLTCHGFGTAASPERAFELHQAAADRGSLDAMFELALYYAQGIGATQDNEASLKMFRAAAEGGHVRAMYNLGAFYARGQLVQKSIPDAVNWYERAAEAGNPSAMVGLAAIYASGDGVEIDLEYARQCLERADFLGLDVSKAREHLGL